MWSFLGSRDNSLWWLFLFVLDLDVIGLSAVGPLCSFIMTPAFQTHPDSSFSCVDWLFTSSLWYVFLKFLSWFRQLPRNWSLNWSDSYPKLEIWLKIEKGCWKLVFCQTLDLDLELGGDFSFLNNNRNNNKKRERY